MTVGESAARAAFDKLSLANACAGGELRIDMGENVGVTLLENMTLSQFDDRFSPFLEDLTHKDSMPFMKADGFLSFRLYLR